MRMRMWMGLLLGLWALPAQAAITWTCSKMFSQLERGYYLTFGNCTGTGTYTTGGDPIGSAATMAATAQALCESSKQTMVGVDLIPVADGGLTTTATPAFDQTNFKVQLFCPSPCAATATLSAGAATVSTGCVAAVVSAASNVACTDQTAAAAVKCTPGTGTLTIAGTGSDVINYIVFPAAGVVSECFPGIGAANVKFNFLAHCK